MIFDLSPYIPFPVFVLLGIALIGSICSTQKDF